MRKTLYSVAIFSMSVLVGVFWGSQDDLEACPISPSCDDCVSHPYTASDPTCESGIAEYLDWKYDGTCAPCCTQRLGCVNW